MTVSGPYRPPGQHPVAPINKKRKCPKGHPAIYPTGVDGSMKCKHGHWAEDKPKKNLD